MSLQGLGPTAISSYLAGTLLPSVTTIRVTNIYEQEDLPKMGFPAATITWTDKAGSIADNTRNRVEWTFAIRIYIDRSTFGASKSEQILKLVGAELLQKIEASPKLGNTCVDSIPGGYRNAYINQGSNNIRLIEVQLVCIDFNTWR